MEKTAVEEIKDATTAELVKKLKKYIWISIVASAVVGAMIGAGAAAAIMAAL